MKRSDPCIRCDDSILIASSLTTLSIKAKRINVYVG